MQLVHDDPWLGPYLDQLIWRHQRFKARLAEIEKAHDTITNHANGHLYFGLHQGEVNGIQGFWYREWAPQAASLSLVGDFNQWHETRHPLKRINHDVWEVFVPLSDGIVHGQRFKVRVTSARGTEDRIPLFARRVIQDPTTLDFAAQVWVPTNPFVWSDSTWLANGNIDLTHRPPLIYEVHIGMSGEAPHIATYSEFTELVLPRVVRLGYNTIQLMAIMEHPYYGSFGYHVSNFFAVSSRFGTPEDLKKLIDTAHNLGIGVYLDIVHSHAASNTREGLFGFDGTEYQFFHQGSRGHHPLWDSKLFDYGKFSVQHFLLSNLKFWLEEYHFDGFRFDGVTSMIYTHHGYGVEFNHYDRYFGDEIDHDGITYLQLANTLIKKVRPFAVTIAEDVSGLPGLAVPIADGGIGFDYRLAMGIPDFWINQLKDYRDEDWSPQKIYSTLSNRRPNEKVISYAECHDQSLVGDKTLIFRMADAEMYHHMGTHDQNLVVERAIALHKIIRLITISVGGEGYLNFMGNEFGHPEWVDFPREGNQWSYEHARRLWSLADNPKLRYHLLENFDQALISVVKNYEILSLNSKLHFCCVHEDDKILAYIRGNLLFVINFHPQKSQRTFNIILNDQIFSQGMETSLVLCTDDQFFGGFNRIDQNSRIATHGNKLDLYLPSRTAVVFALKAN